MVKITTHDKLGINVFELPSLAERLKFKDDVYNPAKKDQSREYGAYSTTSANPLDGIGYVICKPGPKFTVEDDVVKGSVNLNLVLRKENAPQLAEGYYRFSAHSHNYNTLQMLGEQKYRLKKPSGMLNGTGSGDTRSVNIFLGGVVFDTENEKVFIYKSKQTFFWRNEF